MSWRYGQDWRLTEATTWANSHDIGVPWNLEIITECCEKKVQIAARVTAFHRKLLHGTLFH